MDFDDYIHIGCIIYKYYFYGIFFFSLLITTFCIMYHVKIGLLQIRPVYIKFYLFKNRNFFCCFIIHVEQSITFSIMCVVHNMDRFPSYKMV